MARWKGTIAPAAGRDAHEKVLFCADVELSIEQGSDRRHGPPPSRRRVRGACVLIDEHGERHALDVSEAEIVGWPAQVERAPWSELSPRLGDLFTGETPWRGKTAIKLSVRQPGRGTMVVVDGELKRGEGGEERLVARRIALPSKANAVAPSRTRAATARTVTHAVSASGPVEEARASLEPAASAEEEVGAIDRGGAFVPAVWALAGTALGAASFRTILYVRAGLPHPALAHAGWAIAAVLAFFAFLALTRALGIPNEGAAFPGPSGLPELTFREHRRDTIGLDLFAVVGFFTWACIAGAVTMADVAKVARTGDVELRETLRGGRQGARVVDYVHTRAGISLLLAGALGATLWVARRRSARSLQALLRVEPGTMDPRIGEQNAFEGVVAADRSHVRAHDVARWALRREPKTRKPERSGSADSFRLVLRGKTVVVPPHATWASTFTRMGGEAHPDVIRQAWIPNGAHALVAGRVERIEGDEIVLGSAVESEDAVLVFATSPQQSPRALVSSRLFLHHLVGLTTLATLAGGLWMVLRG